MGVLSCHRSNCENIMCDRLSDAYGYICYECFDELVKLGVKTDIKEFMQSEKKAETNEAANRAYFDLIFPSMER